MLETLKDKSYSEKANLKAEEIVKHDLTGTYEDAKLGVTLEITSCEKIEGGVQIFARAWKDGKQLGFGDGSVDIERFRIFNPPLLIDDEAGDIVGEKTNENGEKVERRMRIDPIKAICESLAHTALVSGKESDKIQPGKVGNTTSTFYPSNDARWTAEDAGGTWAGVRDAASAPVDTSNPASIQSSTYFALYIGGYIYDTSTIPDTDTIDSGTHSIYSDDAGSNANSTTYNTIEFVPATPNTIAAGDYDSRIFTNLGSYTLPASSGGYNDMPLNATGLTKISKTSYTNFVMTLGIDISNTATTGTNGSGSCYFSEQTGTSRDPKLVVVHSAAAATTNPAFLLNFV